MGTTNTKNYKTYSRSEIVLLLIRSDKAVERGIVAIYNNQTLDEQRDYKTHYRNNKGFNKIHDKFGTYLAKYILSGKHLDGNFLDKARKLTIYYSKQLVDVANGY